MHDLLQFLSVPANQSFVEDILGGAVMLILGGMFLYFVSKV